MSILIKEINDDLEQVVGVIKKSFRTVAIEFNLTKENAPTNPAFIGVETLYKMKQRGTGMYELYENGICVGFVAINENIILKRWYIKNEFNVTQIKTFNHLPFKVCFMEKRI